MVFTCPGLPRVAVQVLIVDVLGENVVRLAFGPFEALPPLVFLLALGLPPYHFVTDHQQPID